MQGLDHRVGIWSHLRQSSLVHRQTQHKDGTVETEDRVQHLRKRRLRRTDDALAWTAPMRWRSVFNLVRHALQTAAPVPPAVTFSV